jgi:hypothetical protein
MQTIAEWVTEDGWSVKKVLESKKGDTDFQSSLESAINRFHDGELYGYEIEKDDSGEIAIVRHIEMRPNPNFTQLLDAELHRFGD